MFWSGVLAKNRNAIRIATGGEPIVVRTIPAAARIDQGVEGDEIRISTLFAQQDRDLEEAAAEAERAGSEEDEDDDTEE